MSPHNTTERVIELMSQKKSIENEIKQLQQSLFDSLMAIGTDTFHFDIGKVTIVKTKKIQLADEHKVIEKIKEIGMYDEYVEPRLKDIFNIKEFIKEHGMIDGIVETENEPYLKVTAAKDATTSPDA